MRRAGGGGDACNREAIPPTNTNTPFPPPRPGVLGIIMAGQNAVMVAGPLLVGEWAWGSGGTGGVDPLPPQPRHTTTTACLPPPAAGVLRDSAFQTPDLADPSSSPPSPSSSLPHAPAARPLPLLHHAHARGANFAPALWYTVAGQAACLGLALGLAALQFRHVACADLLGAWAATKGGEGKEEEGAAGQQPPAGAGADEEGGGGSTGAAAEGTTEGRGGGDSSSRGPGSVASASASSGLGGATAARGASHAPRGSAASSSSAAAAAAAAAAAQVHKSTPLYVALQCP